MDVVVDDVICIVVVVVGALLEVVANVISVDVVSGEDGRLL